jgi:hypothetical protein
MPPEFAEALQPSLRDGIPPYPRHPALKRRAILRRPSGTYGASDALCTRPRE